MTMKALPTTRLELEQMKFSIDSALQSRNKSFSALVQAELDKTFKDAWIETLVMDQVREVLQEEVTRQIHHYFDYGEGNIAIKEAIAAAFKSAR